METDHPAGRLPTAPAEIPSPCHVIDGHSPPALCGPASSGALLDLAIATAALAGTLALLHHGGVAPTRPGSGGLDLVGVVLAACSTVPLIAWRRFPSGVFAVTAVAGVLLAGLGYPLDLMLGAAAALYLLAASRGPLAVST